MAEARRLDGLSTARSSTSRSQRRAAQMEGISAAKARGFYKGRPASIDAAKVAALKLPK